MLSESDFAETKQIKPNSSRFRGRSRGVPKATATMYLGPRWPRQWSGCTAIQLKTHSLKISLQLFTTTHYWFGTEKSTWISSQTCKFDQFWGMPHEISDTSATIQILIPIRIPFIPKLSPFLGNWDSTQVHQGDSAAGAPRSKPLKSLKTMEVSCVTMAKGHQHVEVLVPSSAGHWDSAKKMIMRGSFKGVFYILLRFLKMFV